MYARVVQYPQVPFLYLLKIHLRPPLLCVPQYGVLNLQNFSPFRRHFGSQQVYRIMYVVLCIKVVDLELIKLLQK